MSLLGPDGRPIVQTRLRENRAAFFAAEARPGGVRLAGQMRLAAHARRLAEEADLTPFAYASFLMGLAERLSAEASLR